MLFFAQHLQSCGFRGEVSREFSSSVISYSVVVKVVARCPSSSSSCFLRYYVLTQPKKPKPDLREGSKRLQVQWHFVCVQHECFGRIIGFGLSQKIHDCYYLADLSFWSTISPFPSALPSRVSYCSGNKISRLPTWLDAETSPLSSICSTKRAALL